MRKLPTLQRSLPITATNWWCLPGQRGWRRRRRGSCCDTMPTRVCGSDSPRRLRWPPRRGCFALSDADCDHDRQVAAGDARRMRDSSAAAIDRTVPAIELMQGWLVVRPDSSSTLKVGLGDRLVTLEVPQNGCAALERSARWVYGRLVSPVPPLLIHGVSGEISVTVAGKEETLNALEALSVDRNGMKRSTEEASPMWANDPWPTPEETKVAIGLRSSLFRAGRCSRRSSTLLKKVMLIPNNWRSRHSSRWAKCRTWCRCFRARTMPAYGAGHWRRSGLTRRWAGGRGQGA